MAHATLEQDFINSFEDRFRPAGNGQAAVDLKGRKTAIKEFERLGLPGKVEAWKYTNLRSRLKKGLNAMPPDEIEVSNDVLPPMLGWSAVVVNGRFRADLSKLPDHPGVVVKSLADALREDHQVARFILERARDTDGEDALVALNEAMWTDGLFVYIPDDTELERPVSLISLVRFENPGTVQPRHIISVGARSKATLIEYDLTDGSGYGFSNALVDISVGDQSTLKHYRLQNKGPVTHVDSSFVHQGEEATYESVVASVGDDTIRNTVAILADGERCHTSLHGLYLATANGHVDNHTLVDHAKADCTSVELYKGILDGKASAAFRGKLMVRRDAQRTNAFQSNRNLLLSDDAEVNALPQLEIYADDVKCSHGATMGLLDQDALFYLRARGIPERKALRMLIEAFVSEVTDVIEDVEVREHVGQMVSNFLAQIQTTD